MAGVKIVTFRDLDVWREAMELAVSCYRLTAKFPRSELFGGLGSQARRAAASIPSNIAEGQVRPTNAFRNHLSIALGSHAELDTQLELATRLHMISVEDLRPIADQLNRTGRMLNRLLASIQHR